MNIKYHGGAENILSWNVSGTNEGNACKQIYFLHTYIVISGFSANELDWHCLTRSGAKNNITSMGNGKRDSIVFVPHSSLFAQIDTAHGLKDVCSFGQTRGMNM